MFSKSVNRLKRMDLRSYLSILLGTCILAFGLSNIHAQSQITEGGVLGMILFLQHWWEMSPFIVSLVLDLSCYLLAFRLLGFDFILLSAIASVFLSGFLFLWSMVPPLLPNLAEQPLFAAIAGAVCVGIGAGLVIRQGGSTGGDDALALGISKLTGMRLSFAYLFTDLIVLLLALSYIPVQSIGYSLLTVTLSSFLVDFVKNTSFTLPKWEQVVSYFAYAE